MITLLLALLPMRAAAIPITLVDTGGSEPATWGLHSEQWLAAEFVSAGNYNITGVNGWIDVLSPGDFTVALWSDAGEAPGTLLQSAVVNEPSAAGEHAWRGVSGLNWAIASGQYWIAFQVLAGSDFSGAAGGAVTPLLNEAVTNNQGVNWNGFDLLDLGVQVFADDGTSAVPEPASLAMLGAGLAVVARRIRRKRQPA